MARKPYKYGTDTSFRFNGKQNGIEDQIEKTENYFYDSAMFSKRHLDFFNRHDREQDNEEYNVLGLIHPASEGQDTEDRP